MRYSVATPDTMRQLDNYFTPAEDGTQHIDIRALRTYKDEPQKSIDNATRFMDMAARGESPKRAPINVVDNGDGTYTVIDGNATTHALARKGLSHARAKVVGKNRGTIRENSVYELKEQKPEVSYPDGKLRVDPIHGETIENGIGKLLALAKENMPSLRAIGDAVKAKIGCQVLARPTLKKAARIEEKALTSAANSASRRATATSRCPSNSPTAA